MANLLKLRSYVTPDAFNWHKQVIGPVQIPGEAQLTPQLDGRNRKVTLQWEVSGCKNLLRPSLQTMNQTLTLFSLPLPLLLPCPFPLPLPLSLTCLVLFHCSLTNWTMYSS